MSSSPISFAGKCLTILIGAGLSWATLTNPEFDRAVGLLFGTKHSSTSSHSNVAEFQPDDFVDLEIGPATVDTATHEPPGKTPPIGGNLVRREHHDIGQHLATEPAGSTEGLQSPPQDHGPQAISISSSGPTSNLSLIHI